MLVIFDVDGTLIGGEADDWTCFEGAIHSVLGVRLQGSFFESLTEVTAQAIAEAAVLKAEREPGTGLEERIRDQYLERLQAAHRRKGDAFAPRPGAAALLGKLRSLPGVDVAIATGDWSSTIRFKLQAAGIDVSPYPVATASDHAERAQIIATSASRAKRRLEDSVYVGDGVWDLRACRSLGIPFVGTGSRTEVLRSAGATHLHPEFDRHSFVETLRAATGADLGG